MQRFLLVGKVWFLGFTPFFGGQQKGGVSIGGPSVEDVCSPKK